MTKLKLSAVADQKPVRVNVDLPADVYRDLTSYAELLTREELGFRPVEPAKLIAPMLQRFMQADREFGRRRRALRSGQTSGEPS